MDRCPICRGRINEEFECKRCGAELALLIQTRKESEALTTRALRLLSDGNFCGAETLLVKSKSLEYSHFIQHLLDFVRSAKGC